MAVARSEDPEEPVAGAGREDRPDLAVADHPGVEAAAGGELRPFFVPGSLGRVVRQPEVAALLPLEVGAELLGKPLPPAVRRHHERELGRGAALLAHEAEIPPGLCGPDAVPFDDDDRSAGVGELVGGSEPEDAGADDDDVAARRKAASRARAAHAGLWLSAQRTTRTGVVPRWSTLWVVLPMTSPSRSVRPRVPMTITEEPDSSASSMISAATPTGMRAPHDPRRGDPAVGQHLEGAIDDRLRLVGEFLGNRAGFPDGHLPDVDDADLALGKRGEILGGRQRVLRVVGVVDGHEDCSRTRRSPLLCPSDELPGSVNDTL